VNTLSQDSCLSLLAENCLYFLDYVVPDKTMHSSEPVQARFQIIACRESPASNSQLIGAGLLGVEARQFFINCIGLITPVVVVSFFVAPKIHRRLLRGQMKEWPDFEVVLPSLAALVIPSLPRWMSPQTQQQLLLWGWYSCYPFIC
jgi:hypothetical protein